MSLLIRFTMYLQTNWSQSGTFESRSILAGTDLLRFTEFWLREKILSMVISQMAHESRSSANHHELGSNSNHGTDDLNLPVDSWVLEASIKGVDLHAIRFAQHLPKTQISYSCEEKYARKC